ncbi:synaptonemal complex central element protein 3 [Arapaima gigas]
MDDSVPWGRELQDDVEGMEQQGKDLEKIISSVENMSVQLTWMAYDMVVLRTCPQFGESLQKLEEELFRCKSLLNSKPLEAKDSCTEKNSLGDSDMLTDHSSTLLNSNN